MSETLVQIREAFEGDSVPRKNIMLRKAYDEIERLHVKLDTAREGLKDIAGRAHSRLASSETV